MHISEVRIKLLPRSPGAEKLRAYCTVTLDGEFVIRDLKIIESAKGAFIAMPSRKMAERCSFCGHKNAVRSKFCNECGRQMRRARGQRDADGRVRIHVDVAHPINAAARQKLHDRVMEELRAEEARAARGNYQYASFDDEDIDYAEDVAEDGARRDSRDRRADGASDFGHAAEASG